MLWSHSFTRSIANLALLALVPVAHLTVHVGVGLVVDHVGGHPLVGAVLVEYLNRGISK